MPCKKKKKHSKISPVFKKRLDFFRSLSKVNIKKQKSILNKSNPRIASDLFQLVKVAKKHPIPQRHYKKIRPFRNLINKIIKKKSKSRKSLSAGLKGGFLSALIPLIGTLASAGISELVKII